MRHPQVAVIGLLERVTVSASPTRNMFTGIVEETGTVQFLSCGSQGATLKVAAERIVPGLKPGDSVAVNGVCLTVTECALGMFSCDLSAETLERTTLRHLTPGLMVNLERPLAVGDRLGGHFVMGHVDGTGRLISRESSGEGAVMVVRFSAGTGTISGL